MDKKHQIHILTDVNLGEDIWIRLDCKQVRGWARLAQFAAILMRHSLIFNPCCRHLKCLFHSVAWKCKTVFVIVNYGRNCVVTHRHSSNNIYMWHVLGRMADSWRLCFVCIEIMPWVRYLQTRGLVKCNMQSFVSVPRFKVQFVVLLPCQRVKCKQCEITFWVYLFTVMLGRSEEHLQFPFWISICMSAASLHACSAERSSLVLVYP